ncbi:hypothetical protein BZZ03_08250 [Lactococcus petauri]|uniref:Uncharacterized protein n=1 Tax=Lactococcus petauri TaxID=1940789 RepID=A0A252CCH3_9LACT|nr:hypothetical protein BZZ03_08250 [Lactococcus petauri]
MKKNNNYNGWTISTIFLLGVIAFLSGFSGSIKVLMFDPFKASIISLIFGVILLLLQLPLFLNQYLEKKDGKH